MTRGAHLRQHLDDDARFAGLHQDLHPDGAIHCGDVGSEIRERAPVNGAPPQREPESALRVRVDGRTRLQPHIATRKCRRDGISETQVLTDGNPRVEALQSGFRQLRLTE